ncbi:MAG: UDP-N-acetylglucosamine 1-carboxyvinyltransferase, partial [Allorhizobium sp.]
MASPHTFSRKGGHFSPVSQALMDRIRIVGGNALNGIIPISGAKNAALP